MLEITATEIQLERENILLVQLGKDYKQTSSANSGIKEATSIQSTQELNNIKKL